MEIKENNKFKPFDLEQAKAGKPVCTRNGRKARIICFDAKSKDYPIVALVEEESSIREILFTYTNEGRHCCDNPMHTLDLVMLPRKREGWINIYPCVDGNVTCSNPYETKEEAMKNSALSVITDTIRIEWYE